MITFPKEVVADVKKHLEDELKKVVGQISDLSKQDPFADTDRLNDNAASDTEANEEINHERFQALITQLNSKVQSIKGALERISKGTYGVCVSCKNLIDTDRLSAIPTATLCMACQAKN